MQWPPKRTDGFLQKKNKSLIFSKILLFCWSNVMSVCGNQSSLAYFEMSDNIDQENPSANDDNTDASNDRSENDYFRYTSCKVRSFFTYRGSNQHLRTCLRKARDVIVTDSQPASSKAINDLQSTTESQQRQNARVIVSEECTNIRWGE